MNHSCVPNASVEFLGSNRAVVMATRAIAADEELCISYLDEDSDLAARTKELAEYQFTCQCERCQDERKAKPKTKKRGKGK